MAAPAPAPHEGNAAGDARSLRGLTVVLFVLAAAFSAVTVLREVAPHDEGLMLQAAARIADGQWPYRDFWWNYGPGQPLLLGGLWEALGPSLLAWRVVRVLLDAAVAVLAFRLVAREAPPWAALLSWLAVAGAMAFPASPGPNPAALALVLGAVLLVKVPDASLRRTLAAGALCGLAALFRPEIGGAGGLAVVLAVRSAWPLATAAGVGLALYAPFLVVAPADLLDDTVGFLVAEQGLQRLPFPLVYDGPTDPNKLLEFYVPLLLLLGTAAWVALARRPVWTSPLLVTGALYLVARPDEFHLVPLSVVLSIALAGAARDANPVARVALVAVLALVALHGIERRVGQVLHPPALAAVPGSAGDGVRTTTADADALRSLLSRIDELSEAGRPILVAPPRFSQVTVGDPLLYVIAGRANPTRYDVMQPGVVTRPGPQREMVRDLERTAPEVVIRWLDPRATRREDDGGGRERGATVFDSYIAGHYGRPERYGPYLLLVRTG